jgi:hypothetical protein
MCRDFSNGAEDKHITKQNNECTTFKYFVSYVAIHLHVSFISAAAMEHVKWS